MTTLRELTLKEAAGIRDTIDDMAAELTKLEAAMVKATEALKANASFGAVPIPMSSYTNERLATLTRRLAKFEALIMAGYYIQG